MGQIGTYLRSARRAAIDMRSQRQHVACELEQWRYHKCAELPGGPYHPHEPQAYRQPIIQGIQPREGQSEAMCKYEPTKVRMDSARFGTQPAVLRVGPTANLGHVRRNSTQL